MGLKDRFNATKLWVSSPMDLTLTVAELVHAGRSTRVVVEVGGEEDATVKSIDLVLRLHRVGGLPEVFALAEVPVALGTHELTVELPGGLPPSYAGALSYDLRVQQHRERGTDSMDTRVVDVAARAEDLFWPAARAGGSVEIALDVDVVAVGGVLRGRVRSGAEVHVEIGPTADRPVAVEGRSEAKQKVKYEQVGEAATSSFEFTIPDAGPPTLHDGRNTTVTWAVKATVDGAEGWRTFGVLDPEAASGARNLKRAAFIPFI